LRRIDSIFGGFGSNYAEIIERYDGKGPVNLKTLGRNLRNELNKSRFKLEIE